ncbi:MAG: hypothetical protein LBK60_04265 [Verrucomicrobiales bacterium]|jgi:predicted DNA-binding transcriptional regulator AlpA|nr:hypothetical protein [Verrucomicrobiales bacterium]
MNHESLTLFHGRAAFTPAEVAKMFGRDRTWAYRRIYDHTFPTLTVAGKRFIAAAAVARLLAPAPPSAVKN